MSDDLVLNDGDYRINWPDNELVAFLDDDGNTIWSATFEQLREAVLVEGYAIVALTPPGGTDNTRDTHLERHE